MKENDWTRMICELLNREGLGENTVVESFRKIPYAYEIKDYSEDWIDEQAEPTSFETDMLIYEKRDDRVIPRVIIESKIGNITTHDAITYSNKASYHKNVMPYVRYGIICGNRETYPLPGRLFRHGTNFDFLFSFVSYEPSDTEWSIFVDMLRKEIRYSQQMEEILNNSRSSRRKRYFMLQKEFHLEEMDN